MAGITAPECSGSAPADLPALGEIRAGLGEIRAGVGRQAGDQWGPAFVPVARPVSGGAPAGVRAGSMRSQVRLGSGVPAQAATGCLPDPGLTPEWGWRPGAVWITGARLGQLRHRFLRGLLPPLGHLIVRLRVVVPAGIEAPWVLVADWPVPTHLRGRCLNDAVHPLVGHIRMGRVIAADVAAVIDWAVLDAANEITEGGWSRSLRHPDDLPDPSDHRNPLLPAGS